MSDEEPIPPVPQGFLQLPGIENVFMNTAGLIIVLCGVCRAQKDPKELLGTCAECRSLAERSDDVDEALYYMRRYRDDIDRAIQRLERHAKPKP